MHVYSSAYACIINEKTKGKIPGEYHVVWIEKQNIPAKKVYLSWRGGGGGAKQDAGIPSTKKFVTPGLESILATDRNSTWFYGLHHCIIALSGLGEIAISLLLSNHDFHTEYLFPKYLNYNYIL